MDEDLITNLLDKVINNDYYANLIINQKSIYSKKINLNSCINVNGKNQTHEFKLQLDDLLYYYFFSPNELKIDNYQCNNCNKKCEIISKKLSIYYLPKILIIGLNLEENKNNDELIDFPLENLDMVNYICGPDNQYTKYNLFAFIGYKTLNENYYYSIYKNIINNKWYFY